MDGFAPFEKGKNEKILVKLVSREQHMKFPTSAFQDVIEQNRKYTEAFEDSSLSGTARQGLAIITCMDSRISPLALVGMRPGDAKILRNAGARVTDDVLRTLVLATYLLGVNRILVMPHTDCRMANESESELHQTIFSQFGVDTRSVEFRTVRDQVTALLYDVTRIRSYPLLQRGVVVGGAIYNVSTGNLEPIDC